MVWSINMALKLMIIYTSLDVYNGYQPILAALQLRRNGKKAHHTSLQTFKGRFYSWKDVNAQVLVCLNSIYCTSIGWFSRIQVFLLLNTLSWNSNYLTPKIFSFWIHYLQKMHDKDIIPEGIITFDYFMVTTTVII